MPATASSTDHPAPYQRNGAATPSATSVTIADSTEVPNTDGFLVVSGARHDGNHESCGTAAKSTGMKPADDLSVGDDIDGSTGREDQANPSAPALGLEFYLLFCGLSMAVFLAALDQTIVSVALSAIAEEFDDLAQVPWVGVGYLLTACSVIPSYGQLADVFGRKSMFLFSIFVFELGSTLCGAARSMNMLIVGRTVAGIGGGGIFSLVLIIISDLVPIEKRGSYNGVIAACFGVASIAGPPIGGVFVDHITWRWVFFINLPIGAVAALTAVFFLRLPSQARVSEHGSLWRRFRRIDWLGTCLLIATVICLLIPLQGGGTLYPWNSPTVIALFVVGAALLVAFVAVEAFVAPQPVVPLRLYCSAHVVGAFAGAFCLYASYFAVVFYVPLWFEVVRGLSATTAGAHIIPFILGVVIVSITVGVVCTVTGHAYVFMPTSVIPTAIGICLLSTLTESSAQWMEIVYLLIIGIGVGMAIQTNLLVGQAAVPMDMLAVVTANINFWQTIGGVMALAICSATLNNSLPVYIGEELAAANLTLTSVPLNALLNSPALIYSDAISDAERGPIIHGFVRAFHLIFRVDVAFAAGTLLSSIFMKKGKLPTAVKKDGTDLA